MEYMTAELLELSGNAARDNKKSYINPRHVQLALRNDEELNKFCKDIQVMEGGVLPNIHAVLTAREEKHAFYNDDKDICSNYVAEKIDGQEDISSCLGRNGDPLGEKDAYKTPIDYMLSAADLSVADIFGHSPETRNGRACLSEGQMTPDTWKKLVKDAAVIDAAGKEAAATVPKAATKSRHRRVLRDNIQGLTKHHFQRLAARAGVIQMSTLIYEESRGVTKVFLENLIRNVITFTEHERKCTVLPEHVISGANRNKCMVMGTGRFKLPTYTGVHPYQYAGDISEDAEGCGSFDAEFKKHDHVADFDLGIQWRKYQGYSSIEEYNQAMQNDRETQVRMVEEAEEEAEEEALSQAEREKEITEQDGYVPGTDVQKKNKLLHLNSLKLARKMQKNTDRVIPFMKLARIVAEIGQDFKTDLIWSPVSINLIDAILENYIVDLFVDVSLTSIHDVKEGHLRSSITPRDMQLSRRIRGERS